MLHMAVLSKPTYTLVVYELDPSLFTEDGGELGGLQCQKL